MIWVFRQLQIRRGHMLAFSREHRRKGTKIWTILACTEVLEGVCSHCAASLKFLDITDILYFRHSYKGSSRDKNASLHSVQFVIITAAPAAAPHGWVQKWLRILPGHPLFSQSVGCPGNCLFATEQYPTWGLDTKG